MFKVKPKPSTILLVFLKAWVEFTGIQILHLISDKFSLFVADVSYANALFS